MNSRLHNIDNSWKEKLNPSQIEAIENVYGPLLVVAGAGSGKTRVLTYRYAHLVSKYNIDIDSILAITFTKKAANKQPVETKIEFKSYNRYKDATNEKPITLWTLTAQKLK